MRHFEDAEQRFLLPTDKISNFKVDKNENRKTRLYIDIGYLKNTGDREI